MFQRRHRFALGVLLLCSVLAPLRASAYPKSCREFVLQQSLAPTDYAQLKVVRATQARLIYLNEKLVRRDFPSLQIATRAEIEKFLINEYGYVSIYANDNAQIQHSGIAVDPLDEKVALVPHTYGRAFLLEGKGPLVDLKGGGVTYVRKNPDGQIVIAPQSVKFTAGAHHQDGLLSLRDAGYEITSSEALQKAVGSGEDYAEANPVYFLIDIGAQIYTHTGERIRHDAAVIEGRRPNIRLYRANEAQAAVAQKSFLHRNAQLYWKGLYHGSLNRYNAEWGTYIDYGTVTGLTERSYRLTALTYVPYGLSDFYGMFGEWSLGQVQGREARLSPFVNRSWKLFLANIAVALGANEAETWEFASLDATLGAKDLYLYLLDIQAKQPARFRWDPSGQTRTQMELVESSEFGVQGAEALDRATSVLEIYRVLLQRASRPPGAPSSSVRIYRELLSASSLNPADEGVMALAEKLVEVEALVRKNWGSKLATSRPWEGLGKSRPGENIVRSKVLSELQQLQDRFLADKQIPAWDAYLQQHTIRLDPSMAVVTDAVDSAQQRQRLHSWIGSGKVRSQLVRLQTDFVDKTFPVVTPSSWSTLDPDYQQLQENTVGLLWRDTRPAGEQFGHSFIRIGKKIYDLGVAQTNVDDFNRMIRNRFFYNFGMLGRSGSTPYYEVLFSVSPESLAALTRYFEDRSRGEASIGKVRTVPHFDVSGRGDRWQDGIIRENCGAFASSFNNPLWWSDYPQLEKATKEMGLIYRMDGATIALNSLLQRESKPLALIAWGDSLIQRNWERAQEVIGFTGSPYRIEVIQKQDLQVTDALLRDEADSMRALAQQLNWGGFQATALPALSKAGEQVGEAKRFNFIRLEPIDVENYVSHVAADAVSFWWRWESGGQYGHVWVSVGDTIYDHIGGYKAQPLKEFFAEEAKRNFWFNGDHTFFVGLTLQPNSADLTAIKTFFEARVRGKKRNGKAVPQPGYEWAAPFTRDRITGERCGMFSTSFANPAWQAEFPELDLAGVAERTGIKYSDGSLFLLHRQFLPAKVPANFFAVGAADKVRREGFSQWDLPSDSLPAEVKETSRASWVIGPKESY